MQGQQGTILRFACKNLRDEASRSLTCTAVGEGEDRRASLVWKRLRSEGEESERAREEEESRQLDSSVIQLERQSVIETIVQALQDGVREWPSLLITV